MFLCKHQNELKSLNIGINLNKIIALYDLIKTKTQRVFRKKKKDFLTSRLHLALNYTK